MLRKQIAAEGNSAAIASGAGGASHFDCHYSIVSGTYFLCDMISGAIC